MQNHFTVHRWERAEPRLTAVIMPPADGAVADLVADHQRYLVREAMLRCVPFEWLHITIAALGWSSEIADNQVTELARIANELLHQDAGAAEITLRGVTAGRTGIHLRIRDSGDVRAYQDTLAAAAQQVLSVQLPPQPEPSLKIAYNTLDEDDLDGTRPYQALAPTDQREALSRPVSWYCSHIALVDMEQDSTAGYYRWTTRVAIPLTCYPRSVPTMGL